MKKILFVWDLRPSCNYGAIATTEALLKLCKNSMNKDDQMRVIDSRAFQQPMPVKGWSMDAEKYMNLQISNPPKKKRAVRKVIGGKLDKLGVKEDIVHIIRRLKAGRSQQKPVFFPSLWEEFPLYVNKVKRGEIFKAEKKLLEWADLVIVNAEGTLVRGTDENGRYKLDGLYLLFLTYIAKKQFNCNTYIINHTVDPGNRDILRIIYNVYKELDGVYIRERLSSRILDSIGISSYKIVPDALFTYKLRADEKLMAAHLAGIDFSKPYICVGDSSGLYSEHGKVKWNLVEVYSKLMERIKEKVCSQVIFVDGFRGQYGAIQTIIEKAEVPYVNLLNCSYHKLASILGGSKIFISGRWHASIMALISGTPILLFGADSHKTEALYDMIDYPYLFFDIDCIPLDIKIICDEANKIISDDIRDKLLEKVQKLSIEAEHNADMI